MSKPIIAIVGRPNVGKSSLLNALLGYDRAIVTDVAGTTRDTGEEKVRVGHVLLRLCDTAGIRDAADTVERLGVERAQQAAQQPAPAAAAPAAPAGAWTCPQCGNTDQDKMNVARRTCGYIGTQFWNQGRTQEIKERVLHL